MSDWQAIEDRIVERVAEALSKRPIPKRLLSLSEAADYLGMDESTVRNKHIKGELPAVRITKRVQFDLADLDALIEREKKR